MALFDHNGLEALWKRAGGPADEADVAAAIAQAESGGDSRRILNTAYPSRPNYQKPPAGALPEYSVGLWQVNMIAWPQFGEAELLDPDGNARAAVTIARTKRGFDNWTTFTKGLFEKYLTSSTTTSGSGSSSSETQAQYAPTTFGGWHQINIALSRYVPAALYKSTKLTTAAGRNLNRHAKR